jgi:hypothetical protein
MFQYPTTGAYDKWKISVVICDADTGGDGKTFEVMNV